MGSGVYGVVEIFVVIWVSVFLCMGSFLVVSVFCRCRYSVVMLLLS